MKRKILLIGWDAADWEVCLPLVEAGKMPALASLLAGGSWGNLATIQPHFSPMLWTSIATGKRPFKHGIHGFSEVDPNTGLVRPITNLSRSCRAIWNILQLENKRSVVTGWWPSHPAEPIDGVMISERFHIAPPTADMPWPLPPGCVHPPELAKHLKALRIHPHHLDESHLLPFIPDAARIDQSKDRRLEKFSRILAECSTVHAAATAVIENEDWDFAAVYYDALDHVCHGFMKYHPPLKSGVDQADFEMYRHVVEGTYRYHDMMLATLLRFAGDDTTVVLISDHGFQSGDGRLDHLPMEPAGPSSEHRRFGIFVARGPGIRKDHRIHGAGLLDVCPTLLALYGLPLGADMDGKVLTEIFENPPAVRSIPSWEEIEGEDGSHPPGITVDPAAAAEGLRQLVALGYIEAPSDDAATNAEMTRRELQYNLAVSYMDAGRYGDAEHLLEELHAEFPSEHRFGMHLSACYHAIGRQGKVTRLTRRLAKDQLRAERAGKAMIDRDAIRHFLAVAAFSDKRFGDALKGIARMSELYRDRPQTRNLLAEIHLRLRRWKEAEESFQKILRRDPENHDAWSGIARARLGDGDFPGAAEAAIASTSLVFARPLPHFLLGIALYRQGKMEQARKAFDVTVHLNPFYAAAHRMLAEIHIRHGGDVVMGSAHHQMAKLSRQRLREARERETGRGTVLPAKPASPEKIPLQSFSDSIANISEAEIITIVSGLPRSGTSMMMQMLEAGGLPVFTDKQRAPDASNPQGYFEAEAVKRLHQDNSWLEQARGHAIKIVAPLLPFLPEADASGEPFHYRVVFMTRPIDEVIASRQRMLGEETETVSGHQAAIAQEAFARSILLRRRIPAVEIDYPNTLRDPATTVGQLMEFFRCNLDAAAMERAVDRSKVTP